jgi:Fe-S cluster biogenesis protein NfuA
VEVVAVHDGIVDVRFHGACVGCPSSNMTLQSGIAKQLRERIPEILEVRALN